VEFTYWSRTVKTWGLRIGDVSYWDKTTPLYIYERIMADWTHLPINRHNVKTSLFTLILLSLNPLICCSVIFPARLPAILGGLAGPKRTSTCLLPTDLSGGGSGAISAEGELYINPTDLQIGAIDYATCLAVSCRSFATSGASKARWCVGANLFLCQHTFWRLRWGRRLLRLYLL
jgi:hypothetical protein